MDFTPTADDSISLRSLQTVVDEWITTVGVRYFSPLTNMAILAEETGEVARLMARIYGDQSFKNGEKPDALADELADLLSISFNCSHHKTMTSPIFHIWTFT